MARAAALPPSRLSPTLPLLSLLLLQLRETGAQDMQVQVLPEVQGQLGSTVELPCHLLPHTQNVNVTQVTWHRLNGVSVAAFHPNFGTHFPNQQASQERLAFVRAGQGAKTNLYDATLAIRDLRLEDEGNYTCEFATFPKGTRSGVTWLRVLAQPQNHAEAQEVTLSLDPVPVARCISMGGRPPAQITWISTLDGEARDSQEAGPQAGTVTVTSRYTMVPLGRTDGVQITCKVKHETFQEPVLLPVILSVRYPPEVSISGYDDNWYLGRTEAILNCDVRSNPKPTDYRWSTPSGTLPASAVNKSSQLFVHSVDRLVNTTFICTVTNAVGTGHAEQVVLVRDTPQASSRDKGPLVWGAVGGVLLVLFLLAASSIAFLLLRARKRRKSPGGAGGVGGSGRDGDRVSNDGKTQIFGNGGPVFWTPTAPGPLRPDGKEEEEDEEEEEEKPEEGLMLPPASSLKDDMESHLDGSLISRRAVYV
ncbi:nectin-2 isoform X3 [Octodon degus]|uniref:Nectin-2 isoform X3 n=1 Tax=Octodon degus TaxID=10160 RepID=A0A6P6DJZ6_OCTDE|nr:nectin-2 isoform X3 [Octodon degus]